MTMITINGTLTLDQTYDVQSGADGDDVEITLSGGLLNGLPTEFRDFLGSLPGTFLTAAGLAYADAVEAATSSGGDPFVTIDPGEANIQSVYFSDGDGNLFDGDQVFLDDCVTAMTTIDGDFIYLHSAMDGQVVLATTSATAGAGELVAAFYLDPAGDLLSAEVTMVTFKAIFHPDGTDNDDSVDFGGLMHVSAMGSLSFDFDGLESGNFLHVAVGGPSAGLLISGRNISVKADGSIIKGGPSASDTVNTSQGGEGTTIGINSQMFTPGAVAVFSLVEGQEAGTSTDVDDVNFTDFMDVNEVSVFISQVQGDKSTPLSLKISTYSAGGVNTDAESGRDYIYSDGISGDALGDDAPVTITQVFILDENGEVITNLAAAGVTITGIGTNVVQVDGMHVLWSVRVVTTDTFNRFHVESVAGDFDIGRIDLADQGLTVTTPVGDALIIDDDGPTVDLAAKPGAMLVVDETADDGDENASGFLAQQSITAANYLGTNDGDAGSDGESSDVFSFLDPGTDAASGLTDTASGEAVVLNLVGGAIVGTTATGGDEVMRWEIDASTGEVTLTLKRAIVHDDAPTDHDENDDPETLSGSGLIVVKREIADNDGDSDSDTADITGIFKFEDDGPGAAISAKSVTFLIDETDGAELAPGEIDPAGGDLGSVTITGAALFTDSSVFGTDGAAASGATVYSLVLSASGVDSGLDDTLSGDNVLLYKEGSDIVGRAGGPAGAEVIRISMNATSGDTTVTLSRAVEHDDTTDSDEAASPAALNGSILFGKVTVKDGDGDSSSAQFDLGALIALEDDGPSISRNATAIPALVTDDDDIEDTASAGFAALFDSAFGSDGFKDADDNDAEDADAIAYALSVKSAGVYSGLVDSLSGDKIYLYLESGVVVGRVGVDDEGGADPAGAQAFTIAVNADTGQVTLTQKRSVVHDDATDPDETGGSAAMLAAADLVTLTATITDGDGDSAEAGADIGGAFAMEDDGPTISRNAVAMPLLTTDDSDIEDSASAGFASLFDSAFGKDGFKDADDDDAEDDDAIAYTLGVKSAGIDSGLDDTQTGDDILLRVNGTTGAIEGYLAGSTNVLAFVITVDADAGQVTLTQKRAIEHDDPADPAETGASAAVMAAADLITLTATITDGDGDTASASADIGLAFAFEDDGPAIGPVDSIVVDYTSDVEGTAETTLNALPGSDLDPIYTITAYKGDGALPIVINGIDLTAQLTDNDTRVIYYQDVGAPGAYDGGVEDVLYYSYALVDTGDADGYIDAARFTVHNAPSAGNLIFDLSELPSGQSLFGILAGKAVDEDTVNPDGPSLLIIGRDVSLNPDGTYNSLSDTINTSQGGGPTTIGNSNQMIDPGEGIYFAYINDPNDSFVSGYPGGLNQEEAGDADNIEYFGGTVPVTGASFQISQTQSNDLPALMISAYDGVGDGTAGSGLQMRDFALDPTAGGTEVEVIAVRVYNENGVLIEDTDNLGAFNDPTVVVQLGQGPNGLSALVSGLSAKYTVEFVTDAPHDISLIEGTAGKFDIGAFQLIEAIPTPDQIFNFEIEMTDGDGDSAVTTHQVRIDGTGVFDDDPLPVGTEGDDTLTGTPGDDEMSGLGGNDLLTPNAGWDVVDGGEGNDTVDYSTSDAGVSVTLGGTVGGGHGEGDVLISIENVTGSEFGDTLTGDGGANVLKGLGGGDTLNGGDGDDLLAGGAGADTIDGGAGTDTADYSGSGAGVSVTVNGGGAGGDAQGDQLSGIENLTGSEFADTLTGDGNANVLFGLGGDDVLRGGGGDDTLDGGAGTDTADYSGSGAGVDVTVNGAGSGGDAAGDVLIGIENLIGSAFADTLTGDGGANVLSGGAGDDELNGGGGDDVLKGGAGADDLDGGVGTDTADYSGSAAGVTVTVNGAASGGDAEGDTLSAIENLTGSAFADTLTGDGGGNVLLGGGGNDLLRGGAGADTLDGGAGTDTADYSGSAAGVTVTVNGAAAGGDAVGDVLTGIENLTGSAQADTLTGDGGSNVLAGGDGDDVLRGDAGADTLDGGAGNDTADYSASNAGVTVTVNGAANGGHASGDVLIGTENLTGSAFADTLTGDGGVNILAGGDGNDWIAGGAGADSISGGAGTDTADYSGSAAGVTVTVNGAASGGDAQGDSLSGIENLVGSAQADSLTGDASANSIDGGSGDDTIAGGEGDDWLVGGSGADSLDGGTGTDTADYSGSDAGVTVTINGAGSGGYAAGDTLSGIENLVGSAFGDVLTGDGGANLLAGGGGNDTLVGGAGADTLDGGDGDDRADYSTSGAGVTVMLNGIGSGGDAEGDVLIGVEDLIGSSFADTLSGDGGANTLSGLEGNDVLVGGAGGDLLAGGSGIDTADYSASAAGVTVTVNGAASGGDAEGDVLNQIENLTGSAQADSLTGAGGTNVLAGGGGDDVLAGLGGGDTLDGGAGTDTADYSASGAGVTVTVNGAAAGGDAEGDVLIGIENLTGSAFADTLTGDGGANVLSGGAGNDTLSGGDGGDRLIGGAGADSLVGGAGIDTADYSGSGAGVTVTVNGVGSGGDATGDTLSGIENLTGSAFADALTGDAGDNVLVGGAGADVIEGGAGIDTVDYSSSTGAVSASLIGPGSGGHAQGDVLTGIENLIGSAFADMLLGDTQANTLIGGANVDTLLGAGGDDVLIGGDGSDSLYGGPGNDIFDGGAGSDCFFVGETGDVVVDGGEGYDKVVIYNAAGLSLSVGSWAGIERVNGYTGNDIIDATGNTTGLLLDGREGNDVLTGGDGNDVLIGGDGDDVLTGGAGNDNLMGGAGNDTFDGGDGDDVIFVGEPGDVVTDGGTGYDKVQISDVGGISLNVGGWTGIERVNGNSGNDSLDATGDTAGITLDGREGNDTLTGGSGADVMFAGAGDDVLIGAAGDDALIGGAGADTLDGGAGNDFLQGGLGADVLVFAAGWGTDMVSGWEDGVDLMDFSGHAGVTAIGDLDIAQVGGDAHVTFGADTIILLGVTATDIDGADFLF